MIGIQAKLSPPVLAMLWIITNGNPRTFTKGCACQNSTTDPEGVARLFTVDIRTARMKAIVRKVVDH